MISVTRLPRLVSPVRMRQNLPSRSHSMLAGGEGGRKRREGRKEEERERREEEREGNRWI